MAFWNMATMEPKRTFRYKVIFGTSGVDSTLALFAQKVKKPSFKLETKPYQYLNHKFHYPGRVEWEASSIDFVDAGGSSASEGGQKIIDVAETLFKITRNGGYNVPTGDDTTKYRSLSKEGLHKQIGNVTVQVLNAGGIPVEQWVMYNAMFTGLNFGELGYDNDEFAKITVDLIYDYADLQQLNTGDPSVLIGASAPNSSP